LGVRWESVRTGHHRIRVHGQDHPDVLVARNNLADAYTSVGRLDEATPPV
jgi:hypothetical protein